MGVDVEGSELLKVNGEEKVVVPDMEDGQANVSGPITFGSHGVDEEQPKEEAKNVAKTNLPKDAVDEWPAEPQVHSFWIVKYRPYEDPKLKSEMDLLDRDIQKKSAQISQLYDEINPKRAEKEELHAILSSLGEEKSQYQEFIDQKRKEMKPLQDALGDLRGPGREKGVAICSSEEELNAIIRSMEYRIQHESVTLKEEKQILRDIKEFEATRPKVVANAAMRAKVQESMGQKEAIQDQVKLLGTDLDGVRKQKAAVQARRDQLHAQVNVLKDQISKLYTDVKVLKEKKQAAFEAMQELRKKREAVNTDYYKNRTIISNVKDLAAKKDVKALEELVNTEVENFMSQWNCNKAFRSNYEKRILLSLDMRQLSRDGRMRNFDEKPLVKAESPVLSETVAVSKPTNKPQKEVIKPTPKPESLSVEKASAETKKGNKEPKAILERSIEEDDFVVEKPKKNLSNGNEFDAAKVKEMKKEEEKEKQRQALERKKKLQEKAAAKAALRAQKEAEKKQKDKQKKLKKKEGSSAQATDEEEPSEKTDLDEPEKSDNVDDAFETPAPTKAKEPKENTLRHRKAIKTRGTLPKAILKKKKSVNYWLWGSAGAAAVMVLMLLILGYNYLLKPQVTI
ncbi:proton pump-interactor 1-like [Silene latifolia]|uniref:proton pump-interactor 1-like n=1 Tax=Silene latifolia TaxID=37657 RepID=UPI003D788FC8